MPYAELLSELISSKGLSIKEVSKRCNESGQNITASYISMIKNPINMKIPSDAISRALAIACEAYNVECLVIEAYIDKAPVEMQEFFAQIRKTVIDSFVMIYKDQFSPEDMHNIQVGIENTHMSTIILEFSKLSTKNASTTVDDVFNTSTVIADHEMSVLLELKQPQEIEVVDNAMYPLIPKGSNVSIKFLTIDKYDDGDILAIKEKQNDKVIVRKCLFNDSNRLSITLFGLSQEYKTINYNLNDIIILGKVIKIINLI